MASPHGGYIVTLRDKDKNLKNLEFQLPSISLDTLKRIASLLHSDLNSRNPDPILETDEIRTIYVYQRPDEPPKPKT